MNRSQGDKRREDAARASAEDGADGPDGVAVTMTPEAAALTAESLQAAAQLARTQPRRDA